MNDRFIILKILYENQVTIGDNKFTPVTQEELGILCNFSRVKENKILIDGGYVTMFNGVKVK